MRPGSDSVITSTVSGSAITTALMIRMEFAAEPVCIWTGSHPLTPMGTGDIRMDGMTFDPVAHGVVADISDNTMSYSGSDELTITVAVPSSPTTTMAAAQVHPAEYQGRLAMVWRVFIVAPADPLQPSTYVFRPIRTGAMDLLEVMADGSTHHLTLTIESHAASISSASGSTYQDQRKFDPGDTSQDFVSSIASAKPQTSSVTY